jgi:hypothetical protein
VVIDENTEVRHYLLARRYLLLCEDNYETEEEIPRLLNSRDGSAKAKNDVYEITIAILMSIEYMKIDTYV